MKYNRHKTISCSFLNNLNYLIILGYNLIIFILDNTSGIVNLVLNHIKLSEILKHLDHNNIVKSLMVLEYVMRLKSIE